MQLNQIIQGDCLEVMRTMPEGCFDCCVTSPPYWGLRDYGTASWDGGEPDCDHRPPNDAGKSDMQTTGQREHAGRFSGKECWKCGATRVDQQLGLEPTPEEYTARMVEVFAEVKRVLKPEGTLWLNIGDTYFQQQGKGFNGNKRLPDEDKNITSKVKRPKWLKPKDLMGMPWMLAIALRADGWYLRSDIIWHKPNGMPESCTDRPTSAHEHIFLFSKNNKYYYDGKAIAEPTVTKDNRVRDRDTTKLNNCPGRTKMGGLKTNQYETKNARNVWTMATKGYPEAHFATFPPELPRKCILAGCPPQGVVLDPFFGSGTVGMVAIELGRQYVGIELSPEYCEIARKRTAQQGLFQGVEDG